VAVGRGATDQAAPFMRSHYDFAFELQHLRLNEVGTACSPLIEINAKSALMRQSFRQIG
jgi:hypothetical protein